MRPYPLVQANEDSEPMKLATIARIILTAALAASSPLAFAQGSGGGAGSSAGASAAGGASSSGTVGSSAGSSNTSGVSNEAGSAAAGRNSMQNPSGNSYINPPAGAPPATGAGRR
jgi:hypothetical protein